MTVDYKQNIAAAKRSQSSWWCSSQSANALVSVAEKGSHQELKMLTTLGLSDLAATPDAAGLAVGEQLLRNYQDTRYETYFKNSPVIGRPDDQYRINTSDTFDGSLESIDPSKSADVFEAKDKQSNSFKKMFSGQGQLLLKKFWVPFADIKWSAVFLALRDRPSF